MRLLNVHNIKLETFYNDRIPPFAILSHTWLRDDEEVTYAQIQTPEACAHMEGFKKIDFLCAQAKREGYDYAWIDTCCIDKTSSAELSEAINSMFDWYERSDVCYVFLSDVEDDEILKSRWWTRAWTLQELLAPRRVKFFNNGVFVGTKNGLAQAIKERTGIDSIVLLNPLHSVRVSAAHRMAWAARRTATRTEDIAYSLLGIFQVNMPLLYGEGEKAFLRLQGAILQQEHDQTLFAWSLNQGFGENPENKPISEYHGLLASTPKVFADCGDIVMLDHHGLTSEVREFHGGHHLDMYVGLYDRNGMGERHKVHIGILPCLHPKHPECFLVIKLIHSGVGDNFMRYGAGTFLVQKGTIKKVACRPIHIRGDMTRRPTTDNTPIYTNLSQFLTITIDNRSSYSFHSSYPSTNPHWKKSETYNSVAAHLHPEEKRRSIVAFYKRSFNIREPSRLVLLTFEFGPGEQYRKVRSLDYHKVPEESIPVMLESAWKGRYSSKENIKWRSMTSTWKHGLVIRGIDWRADFEIYRIFGRYSYVFTLEDKFYNN